MLAFESISKLKNECQEDVGHANNACPRMRKKKFMKSGGTGFPLENFCNALGTTKVRTHLNLKLLILIVIQL